MRQFIEHLEIRRLLATFIVSNTSDTSNGSLRQAITSANLTTAADRIEFNITGAAVKTITPGTPLPAISQPLTIDGYTQPGAQANTLSVGDDAVLLIRLVGQETTSAAGLGVLTINAPNCEIRGLNIAAVSSFSATYQGDIVINGAGGNTIAGNFLGTSATGGAGSQSPRGISIGISSPIGNTFGGPSPADRNIISNHVDFGIRAVSDGNTIQNNYIGTDATGVAKLANGGGIGVLGTGLTIQGNLISGNAFWGARLTLIQSTFSDNQVGIGADGATPLGNGSAASGYGGVIVSAGGNNSVYSGNVIADNVGYGIGVSRTTQSNTGVPTVGNQIYANSIYDNTELGIDLAYDLETPGMGRGVTENDPQDADNSSAGNAGQNFPVLSAASVDGDAGIVTGTLNSMPDQTFSIDLYSSATADDTGYGEGKTYLGRQTVTTDDNGDATLQFTGISLTPGEVVAATATSSVGNTSEFSAALMIDTDHTPPAVEPGTDIQIDQNPPAVQIVFSEPIDATNLTPSNIEVDDLDTGDVLSADSLAIGYDPITHTALVSFPGYPNNALPDGNYRLTIPAGTVTDQAGNAIDEYTLDFFSLAADANHDRMIDSIDFDALATNFGQPNLPFSSGDFNYDGQVNALDFNILATKFGTALAPAMSIARPDSAQSLPNANLFGEKKIRGNEEPLIT